MSEIQENENPKKPDVVFSWKDFKFDRILLNNTNRKVIFVLGTCFEQNAILILEKVPFTDEQFASEKSEESLIENSVLEEIFTNDIYGNFSCIPDVSLNKLKVTTIFPATEKHIKKYSDQKTYIFQETPELYAKVTLPTLMKEQFTCDWVYNILEHKTEKDRIIVEDLDPEVGFVLLPDLKWDGTISSLYVTAIIMNRNIKSIRDLRERHIPLLENIKTKCLSAIKGKYGITSDQIRAYFHYQPSYYHLHVHFNHLKYEAPGIFCDKAHLLDTVLDNLKMMPNYYEKATLSFVVGENHVLYAAHKDAQNALNQ